MSSIARETAMPSPNSSMPDVERDRVAQADPVLDRVAVEAEVDEELVQVATQPDFIVTESFKDA